MRKLFKWLGLGIGAVAVLAVLAIGTARILSGNKLSGRWHPKAETITLPTDPAAIEEGKRLVAARGCTECHGADLGGKVAIEEPAIGSYYGANLTSGKGGVGKEWSDEDYVRAIRHCVRPDGSPLLVMPCLETRLLTESDLAAILAYIRAAPPVDRENQPNQLTMLAHVLNGFGVFDLVHAASIDHDAPRPADPPKAANATYGERLARIQCVGCHGDQLSGGPIPGAPPSMPVPANITPDQATGIGKWQRADFATLLRTGKRPDGSDVNPFMPWGTYKNLDETEIDALWAYVRTVPAKEFGNR